MFLRTEVRIGILQTAYAAVMLALAIGGLVILYRDILSGVGAAFTTALTSTTPLSPALINAALEAVRTREIIGISSLIAIAAVLFGYLVSHLALVPARGALDAQKKFIGNVAHELRTPLAIIKTNTEVRLLDTNVPSAARKMHEENLEELNRISDIINNLLTLNSLMQPEALRFAPVPMQALADTVCERLRPFIRGRPITLRSTIAKAQTIHGNAAALEQILFNTVKNALQHTRSGSITVSIDDERSGYCTLRVRDTGAGISHKDLARIFQPFYRGDSARARSGGSGSGLGLAIVSELVKLHRGRITIRSTEGKGTLVMVTLPPGPGHTRAKKYEPAQAMNEVSANFMA